MFDIILSTGIQITYNYTEKVKPEKYRWVNLVLVDPYSIHNCEGQLQVPPYVDPPFCGMSKTYKRQRADMDIYYYDNSDFKLGSKDHNISYKRFHNNEFTQFRDFPTDPRLQPGEYVEFLTCMVDTEIQEGNDALGCVTWRLNHDESISLLGVEYSDLMK